MSKETVKKMFENIHSDAKLMIKYADIMQQHQKEMEKNLSDKLIELGKTAGFVFSKDDLIAAKSDLIDRTNESKELCDSDLENVAGGATTQKTVAIICSIFTVGVGCAGMSIAGEMSARGQCSRAMTTSDPDCKNTI